MGSKSSKTHTVYEVSRKGGIWTQRQTLKGRTLCEDEERDQSDAAKAKDHQQSPARAFLVAPWLRICLPEQATWVWKDSLEEAMAIHPSILT